MKRNLDLIRDILLHAEEHCNGENENGIRIFVSKLPKQHHAIEETELREHINLAVERGLLMASWQGQYHNVFRLTWEGHDFLDNSRSSVVWKAAKKAAGHMSFTVFVTVLARLAADRGLELLKSKSPELLELLSAGFGGA